MPELEIEHISLNMVASILDDDSSNKKIDEGKSTQKSSRPPSGQQNLGGFAKKLNSFLSAPSVLSYRCTQFYRYTIIV
jgi:hypothetical protein